MTASLRHLQGYPRRFVLLLLVGILAARLAVPAGWMPMADAQGIHLTLCSGMGAEMPSMPGMSAHDMAMPGMAGMDHGKSGDHAPMGDHPCSGAGVVAGLDAPPLALILPVRAAHDSPPLVSQSVSVGHGLAAPPPPSTGPPAFA